MAESTQRLLEETAESVDKSEPQSDEPSSLKATLDASERIPTDQHSQRRRGKSILQDPRAAQNRPEEREHLTFPSGESHHARCFVPHADKLTRSARSPLPELKANEVVGTVITIYLEAGKYALR
jgi:hypothetical protein